MCSSLRLTRQGSSRFRKPTRSQQRCSSSIAQASSAGTTSLLAPADLEIDVSSELRSDPSPPWGLLRLRLGGLPTDPEASGGDARLALRQSLALRVLARVAFAGAGSEPFSMRF